MLWSKISLKYGPRGMKVNNQTQKGVAKISVQNLKAKWL